MNAAANQRRIANQPKSNKTPFIVWGVPGVLALGLLLMVGVVVAIKLSGSSQSASSVDANSKKAAGSGSANSSPVNTDQKPYSGPPIKALVQFYSLVPSSKEIVALAVKGDATGRFLPDDLANKRMRMVEEKLGTTPSEKVDEPFSLRAEEQRQEARGKK